MPSSKIVLTHTDGSSNAIDIPLATGVVDDLPAGWERVFEGDNAPQIAIDGATYQDVSPANGIAMDFESWDRGFGLSRVDRAGSRNRYGYTDGVLAMFDNQLMPSYQEDQVDLLIRNGRMDVDTTGWKGAHDHLVEDFRQGKADVLLGTQMVAKGLDFPAVTLVGVISADTGLHMPDFRASERSFQLLTQVAGRSGRGTIPGEVVIQTMLPTDPVLQAASRQDFAAFVENELDERRAATFPPFGRLILFRWRGKEEKAVITAAQQGIARLGHDLAPDQTILGPAPAPLTRLREFYRYQALLTGPTAQTIHRTTAKRLSTMRAIAQRQSVSLHINVDPLSIM